MSKRSTCCKALTSRMGMKHKYDVCDACGRPCDHMLTWKLMEGADKDVKGALKDDMVNDSKS